MVARASSFGHTRLSDGRLVAACANCKNGVSQGSTSTSRPVDRSTRCASAMVLRRSSGSRSRWCRPPCTTTTSWLLSTNGSVRQSATQRLAEPSCRSRSSSAMSIPCTRRNPSCASADSPLPRPQHSSTIETSECQSLAPNPTRRLTNLRHSSSGVSNRRYAACHRAASVTRARVVR